MKSALPDVSLVSSTKKPVENGSMAGGMGDGSTGTSDRPVYKIYVNNAYIQEEDGELKIVTPDGRIIQRGSPWFPATGQHHTLPRGRSLTQLEADGIASGGAAGGNGTTAADLALLQHHWSLPRTSKSSPHRAGKVLTNGSIMQHSGSQGLLAASAANTSAVGSGNDVHLNSGKTAVKVAHHSRHLLFSSGIFEGFFWDSYFLLHFRFSLYPHFVFLCRRRPCVVVGQQPVTSSSVSSEDTGIGISGDDHQLPVRLNGGSRHCGDGQEDDETAESGSFVVLPAPPGFGPVPTSLKTDAVARVIRLSSFVGRPRCDWTDVSSRRPITAGLDQLDLPVVPSTPPPPERRIKRYVSFV